MNENISASSGARTGDGNKVRRPALNLLRVMLSLAVDLISLDRYCPYQPLKRQSRLQQMHSVYSILRYVKNRCLPKRVPFPG